MELTPLKIIEHMTKLSERLGELNRELIRVGTEKAEAERDYRVALAKQILILKADKLPATLIQDLSRGDEHVAALKLTRDALEARYDVTRDNIRSLRDMIEIDRSALSWLKTEYQEA